MRVCVPACASLLLLFLVTSAVGAAELKPETLAAWETYRRLTEARIERELEDPGGFLVREFFEPAEAASVTRTLERGEIFVGKLQTKNEEGGDIKIPSGLVHHWYGSVLVPNAELEDVLDWEQDYDRHQEYFDDVEQSELVARQGDDFEVFLRLRRKKVITVHYNTEHVVNYERLGPKRAVSRSVATRIAELDQAGTQNEREKPVGNDRGYLWRLNSYWRFQETSEGVVVELESISLSRRIPIALRWLVQPFITSVPKESVEATLRPLRATFSESRPALAPAR